MMKRFLFLPIFFLLFALTGCDASSTESTVQAYEATIESCDEDDTTETQGLTVGEKLEDFEYLFNIIASNYPFLEMNKRQHGVNWIANKDDYIERLQETEGDLKYYIVLNNIVKDLNYDHTSVFNNTGYANVLRTYKNVMLEPWLEVLEDPVVQSRYLNAVKDEDQDNVTEAQEKSGDLILDKWDETSTAYIKISSFNRFNIEEDWGKMQPFINDLDDIHSLIIDIRGNGGGDTTYWTDYLVPELISESKESSKYFCFRGGEYSEPFIISRLGYKYSDMEVIDEAFIKAFSTGLPAEIKTDFKYYITDTMLINPIDDEGYLGDIYLLVDRYVSSSSQSFMQFMSDTDLAYIIGEPTAGEGSGFDPLLLRLPNSGYVIRFPGVMVLNSEGANIEETIVNPDLLVDTNIALEKAIELIKINNE
ncbi:MAG: S41 family peptidase [Bacillota bacterium]|nr:S41 family peptidase [Bacillota bacterium]